MPYRTSFITNSKEIIPFNLNDNVLDFISNRFQNDCNWTDGNCFYFAKILETRFPGGTIYYDVIDRHFIYGYKGNYYDYNGIVEMNGRKLVAWNRFKEYDINVYKRVIRDCIE